MKKMVLFFAALGVAMGLWAQDREAEMATVLAAPASASHRVRVGDVRLELRGMYVLGGLLWFSLRVSNGSVIDWRGTPMRILIRDRRVWKRRARQELTLATAVRRETLLVRSDSAVALCYGLSPRLPGKGQDLVLEWRERNGDRRMILRLDRKDILHSKKLDRYASR